MHLASLLGSPRKKSPFYDNVTFFLLFLFFFGTVFLTSKPVFMWSVLSSLYYWGFTMGLVTPSNKHLSSCTLGGKRRESQHLLTEGKHCCFLSNSIYKEDSSYELLGTNIHLDDSNSKCSTCFILGAAMPMSFLYHANKILLLLQFLYFMPVVSTMNQAAAQEILLKPAAPQAVRGTLPLLL